MQNIIKIAAATAILLASCGSTHTDTGKKVASVPVPEVKFNADSAYSYIKHQVEFGARIPGTVAHQNCVNYIINELTRHGVDTVFTQNAEVTAFTGDKLPITNIIASINPESKDRVLLAAHFDTRPWADNEDNSTARNTPILGANDGGSGVGVLLELARILAENRPEIGVDFLFVDAEDYGDNEGWGNKEETWCLGTQYWCANNHYTKENRPMYGIVLDMVGGTNAKFHREYYSNKSAAKIVNKVWGTAAKSGFSTFFPNEIGGALIDDHLFIDRSGIPCIDIVECNNTITRSFPPTWHTLRDNMASIDTAPLRAVGQTVLNVILSEKAAK